MAPNRDPFADALSSADELIKRFKADGIAADMEEAVRIQREVLDQRAEGDPHRDKSLYGLAECLRARFGSQQVMADLREAVVLYEVALQLRPARHPKRSFTLGGLAKCLELKFRSEHELADLDAAISIHQDVLGLRPEGHPYRSWTLNSLASCFETRFHSQRKEEDLEKAVMYYREGLEHRHVGHPHRASTLSALAVCLRSRFRLLRVAADLDESILHFHAALDLRPEGHPLRHFTLSNLALALESKFQSQRTAVDLNEAICLHRAALRLRLVGDPLRPSSLHNLANCLRLRFDLQRVTVDLNEAIDLRRTLVGSHPSGDAKQSQYLRSLADCLEARYNRVGQFCDLEEATKIRQELPDPDPSYHPEAVDNLADTKRVLTGVMEQILESLPPRLLDTAEGVICDRQLQIAKFESSSAYGELLESARDRTTIQHSDIEDIRTRIATYFRYATLSHRWGKGEPLLEHVEGRNIYHMSSQADPQIALQIANLDGLDKLQNFCRVAAEHGFLWAWSDTCCIDKKNSIIEVQEAIGAMFSWYRQSSLTITYLADVPPSASPDELSGSEWFRRGWTLQELLASRAVLFYLQDWSLYLTHETCNHKHDNGMLMELEKITDIASRYLTDFSPGMGDARLRLRWASNRRTTRPEDTAYSLFGIFNIHLPILYGEAKQNALGRLLQEIVSRSGDTSVLDWTGASSSFHSCFPASIDTYRFAPSAQPELDDTALERSLSRLQRFINAADATRFYRNLIALPFPQFSSCRLLLPLIVHRIQKIHFSRMDSNNYIYEVEAANLRPLTITSSDELKHDSQAEWLSYLIVRVLDQRLMRGLREGDSDSAYKVMVELDQPFSALLLEEVSLRTYRRIASSRMIVARIDDPKALVDSEFRALSVV